MSNTRLLAIILFLAVSMNCSDKSPVAPTDVSLENTLWRLEIFELDSGSLPAADDQVLTLRLNGETKDGYFAQATADCNDCGGPYSIWASDSISVGMGCTEMACPPGTQGYLYTDAMSSTTVFDLDGDVLRISFANDYESGVLVFRADTHIEEIEDF